MTHGGKVVHVSDQLHQRLRKYCKKYNISMSEWIEQGLELCIEASREVEHTSLPEKLQVVN